MHTDILSAAPAALCDRAGGPASGDCSPRCGDHFSLMGKTLRLLLRIFLVRRQGTRVSHGACERMGNMRVSHMIANAPHASDRRRSAGQNISERQPRAERTAL
ncbi:hypothetical protein [Rhodopila globiformis]|uniref:hypothetical protein n=1 Tax=Rhodopila globiformis TaxID=1071 RepID=UPI0011B0949E|nr:hypothetical protein [Rhodopila globiformis]